MDMARNPFILAHRTSARVAKFSRKEVSMKKTFAISFLLAVMLVGSAFAEIPDRIKNQQSRINAGIASGKLTQAEAEMLEDNLHWIRASIITESNPNSMASAMMDS